MVGAQRRRARAPSLRPGAPRAEARALSRGARKRRQRQADPRIARHRHSPGRAAFLSPRRLGLADRERIPRPPPRRRLRADHSLELPAADAGVEDRAGARGGQHGRAQAGRIHAADRARLRRNLHRGRAAAGRRQHRHRRRRDRRGAGRARRRRQDRLHRLDRGRARHPQGDARARARNCRWSSAANRRSSSSRTPISTARSRASSTRSGSIRGRSAAPARGCWPPRAIADKLLAKLRARMATSARRRSAGQIDRHRRHRRAGPARAHQAAGGRRASARARRSGARPARCPSAAASIRRRWSPTSSPPRCWRARRSSARCWWR